MRRTYGIAFQGDGALAATGDLGGVARLWDLRTGRSPLALEGHSKQVLCCDFAPNGFLLATGSGDNSVKLWDIRHRKCAYTIPAHCAPVSSVRFAVRVHV
jgi:U4/U6 small nuclear ribonucleoprotein PRP4